MNAARVMILAVTVSCLASCGLTHVVDGELLLGIGLEHKVGLFDAENDVSIAIDEREAITRQIHEILADIDEAEAQIAEAMSDGERAQVKGDTAKMEIAALAAEVFQLKIDYLEDMVDYLKEKRVLQDTIILVAQARFELEKAKLVKKINVRGAEGVNLEEFEAQVDAKVEAARSAQEELQISAQATDALKTVWLERRDTLNQASGGGLGSPWAEDGGLWGVQ